jgi:hypothetical protein
MDVQATGEAISLQTSLNKTFLQFFFYFQANFFPPPTKINGVRIRPTLDFLKQIYPCSGWENGGWGGRGLLQPGKELPQLSQAGR